MSDSVRIGVIGTSRYSENYLSILGQHENVILAAVCGRNQTRAEEVAGKYQVSDVYTDYREMLRRGKLDAVIIATPDDLHYPMTIAALEAGLHVLCEKPMALNANQAGEMLEAAERTGVKHLIEFSWRWMPHYQYLKQMVADDFVGQGYHYHFRFLGDRGRVGDYTWRFDSRRSLGVLGDLGSHFVDLARWIGGPIETVSAHLDSFTTRVDPEGETITGANETALLTLGFADGAQGMVHVSTIAHTAERWREQYVSLHGKNGTLEVDWKLRGRPDQPVIIRGAKSTDKEFSIFDVPDDYLQGVSPGDFAAVIHRHLVGSRLFVDAILKDYMPEPNFRDGYEVQRVLDAAIESQSTGYRISLTPI